MARSPDWEKVPMAEGGKGPMWPLPTVTPKFATWSLGGGRPSACAQDKCERWHAGVDLTNAPQGAVVIAPEDALIVGLDKPVQIVPLGAKDSDIVNMAAIAAYNAL